MDSAVWIVLGRERPEANEAASVDPPDVGR